MNENKANSLVEEIIGTLWFIVGFLALGQYDNHLMWKILTWVAFIQGTLSQLAAICFAIKHTRG